MPCKFYVNLRSTSKVAFKGGTQEDGTVRRKKRGGRDDAEVRKKRCGKGEVEVEDRVIWRVAEELLWLLPLLPVVY